MLDALQISFLNYRFENFFVKLPQNQFGAEKLRLGKISAESLSGVFDENLDGAANFRFYGSEGRTTYDINEESEGLSAIFNFNIDGINLHDLVRDLSEEIYISGILNVDGNGSFTEKGPEIAVSFRTKPARGVKQVMNFGAIRVLASLGGGSPVKALGSSDFRYSLIAGKMTVKDGYLTIEGLAGKKGDQNLLIRGGLFGGINLAISKDSNTIKIDELKRRIISTTQTLRK